MTRHSKDADAAFKQYREAAPDHVDDDTLRKVITKCNNNPEAIQTALQNFWEDIGNKPSTDEWKTTNKTKKIEPEKPQPKSQSKIEERGGRGEKGGRGGAGRGSGGRGVSAGRGATAASSSSEATASLNPAATASADPAALAPTATGSTTIANGTGKKDRERPIRQPRPTSESTSAPIAAPKTSAWASADAGDNWAAHIKKKILEQEIQVKDTSPLPVDESKEDMIAGRSRDKRKGKSKDKSGPSEESVTQDLNNNVAKISIHDDNIVQTNNVKLTEIVPSLTQSPNRNTQSTQQQENEQPVSNQEQTTFFKMGKWEIPTPVEENAFQFGSFGSLGDNAAVNHSSSWGVVPDSVTNQNSDNSSWSTNQNNDMSASSNSNMGSVLLGNNNAANSNLGNRYTPKTNELEPQQQKTQNRNAPGQNRQNKHEQNQQYGQYQAPPPGIPIPIPAARGPVASMPYSYAGVYDQSQYYSPAASMATNPAIGAAGTTAAATAVNTATPATATPATATTQAPQQAPQQQYPPGMNGNPYGFYPSYFPNQQYYYGGQFPNVYSQGRNVYQPPRPYGADPYGSAGSLYGDVYQSGQFPDSTGNYGNMPMHPSMPLPVAGNNAGGKTKSAAVPGAQVPDHNAHSAYNPYPYNRADAQAQQQWQYQQNAAAAGWGAPMMMSSAPSQQMPQQGFSQQSTMQSQANGRETQRTNTSGASIHGNSSSFVRGNAGSEQQQRW